MFDAQSSQTAGSSDVCMVTFDEACRRIAQIAAPLGAEGVALDRGSGRILAAPVVAGRCAPPVAVSAMDGYAVREVDIAAGARSLAVVGEVFAAGPVAAEISPGCCVRIFTGAPLPMGADRVVIQEIVRREGEIAILTQAPGAGRHVRQAGSDFRQGDHLLEPGVRLTPQALVAAAAADVGAVTVFRRPRVSILCTGDELVEPGMAAASPGAVPDSLSHGVAAMAQCWGAEVVGRGRLRDDLPALVSAAGAALDAADVVIATGGASVGERDFARAMFEPFGLEPVFVRVAIKPGKPVWLARVNGRLVLGLPGNPSAALVTARLFLAPLIAGLAGSDVNRAWRWRMAPLARDLSTCGDRETFVRGQIRPTGVTPLGNQDSSAQKALAMADQLIRVRPGHRLTSAGELVEALDF